MEAQFTVCNITKERTKFNHVVASLAPEYAIEVHDLLLALPEQDAYSTLKAQLIQCTATSEQWHLQQLLTTKVLGDRKPSQLLRKMQQLLGDAAGPNPNPGIHPHAETWDHSPLVQLLGIPPAHGPQKDFR